MEYSYYVLPIKIVVIYIPNGCIVIEVKLGIWRFPEIGVPPVIIHFHGIFPSKPTRVPPIDGKQPPQHHPQALLQQFGGGEECRAIASMALKIGS